MQTACLFQGIAGQRAIVTGASQGIGEGIARLLAENGAEVAVTHEPDDRRAASASHVVNEIRTAGGSAYAVPLDLAGFASVDHLIRTVTNRGPIHLLVNNAFWWNNKRFEEQTWDDFQKFARVNFGSTAHLTQHVLRHMRESGTRGAVITITSVHQETVRRMHPPYGALKAALAMLTEELAVEYGPYGIRVNSVAPGHIETRPDRVQRGERTPNFFVPLGGRSGLPSDIAKAVAFLACHDLSGHITGTTLVVDGGERLFGEWALRIPPGT